MKPDPTKTRIITPTHSIEVGTASWSDSETSIRNRHDLENGKFTPHRSSELPIRDIRPIMEVAAQYDLLSPADGAGIIEAIAASLGRRSQ